MIWPLHRQRLTNVGVKKKKKCKYYLTTFIISEDEAREYINKTKVQANLKLYKPIVFDIYI